MADVNPGLAAQAENGATVIGVNPNAIVQEEVAPPKVERMNRPVSPARQERFLARTRCRSKE